MLTLLSLPLINIYQNVHDPPYFLHWILVILTLALISILSFLQVILVSLIQHPSIAMQEPASILWEKKPEYYYVTSPLLSSFTCLFTCFLFLSLKQGLYFAFSLTYTRVLQGLFSDIEKWNKFVRPQHLRISTPLYMYEFFPQLIWLCG